jgi:two-component system sensor histidine kinase MprB
MTPSPSRTHRRRISFRARLGTFIAVAVGLTVALASLVSYFTVRNQLLNQVDSSLRAAWPIDSLVNTANADAILHGNGGFVQVIAPPPIGGLYGTSLVGDPYIPTAEQREVAAEPGAYRIETVVYQGQPYRVITQFDYFDGLPAALQVARPLSVVDHTLSTLRLILWLVTLGGVGLAVGLGYLIGRETLRPVARLTAAAEYVAATLDLGSPIEVEADDELGRLARSFNAMLAAVALSRRQQAQLISDAGHELRTPLTSLRTNIELLMRAERLPDRDRAELMSDVEAQLQELTTLIGDLVDLARHEEVQPEPIEVRLDHLVRSAVERARRRAPAGVRFEVHLTPGSVRANPPLLERAVLNVLDNAVKWSPPEGTVAVWLRRGERWSLDVADQGPGIDVEDLPRIFDRFYRASAARSMPGSGLGLAIVAQVVAAHGGSVRAWSPPEGGTVIHLELPVVAEDEAPGAGEADVADGAGEADAADGAGEAGGSDGGRATAGGGSFGADGWGDVDEAPAHPGSSTAQPDRPGSAPAPASRSAGLGPRP